MKQFKILSKPLTLKNVYYILRDTPKLELSNTAIQNITKCREYLDNKVKTNAAPIYGVTTGFGSLCNTSVSEKDLGKLQENLMMSHACGIGEEVPQEIVKLMLLLKIQSLSYGHYLLRQGRSFRWSHPSRLQRGKRLQYVGGQRQHPQRRCD